MGTRITWQDIATWQALHGIALDAFELNAVMQLDAEIRDWHSERARSRAESQRKTNG